MKKLSIISSLALSTLALVGCKNSTKTNSITTNNGQEENYFVEDFICDYDIFKTTATKNGTVHEITYQTRSYYTEALYPAAGQLNLTKTAYVYLPYGYDPDDTNTKYDVLYLLHGSGLNEGYWFAKGTYTESDTIYTKGFGTENLLDNMMEQGLCKKAIIVTPTLYSKVDGYEVDANNEKITSMFYLELKNDLMPYVASNYNTYAKDGTDESLKEARDHQAYAGLSLGSMTSFSSVFYNMLDYISYIGSFSGASYDNYDPNGVSTDQILQKYNNQKINYWLASCGTSDNPHYSFLSQTYANLKEGLNLQEGYDLSNGDNTSYIKIKKGGHNYATWITALYNSMLVFFKA